LAFQLLIVGQNLPSINEPVLRPITTHEEDKMQKTITESSSRSSEIQLRAGKVKYALLGWLIGLPIPIVIILLFVRGCDF
jgi:hypothetical protein